MGQKKVSNQNVEEIEEVEILTIVLQLFLEETETDEKRSRILL